MTTISQIRAGIETRLQTLDTIRVTQEFIGPLPVSGNASVAVVEYAGATYDTAFGGQGDALNFGIVVLASKLSDRAGVAKLDDLCDPTSGSVTSVRTAVNGKLGGIVTDAAVRTSSGYQEYAVDEQKYLGVEFVVEVQT